MLRFWYFFLCENQGPKQEGKGFQFPGEFEITAVGNASANLPTHVPQLLERVGLHVLHESVRHRHSGVGNAIAASITG